DRTLQARPLPPADRGVRRLPLRGGEEADPAADQGADDRSDERKRDGDDRADDGGDRGALGDWVFKHAVTPNWCIIVITRLEVQRHVAAIQPGWRGRKGAARAVAMAELSSNERAVVERASAEPMLDQVLAWSAINSGSRNPGRRERRVGRSSG